MAYPVNPILTRVTQISSNEYLVGANEKCPAVHFIDDTDPDIQILIYNSSMSIEWGDRIYFEMKVLKWVPEFQKWYILNYTPPFNTGRMIVDNQTLVDPLNGLPVTPEPVDDPNTPQNELDNYMGEYAFWEATMGAYIIPAVQDGAARRFNAFI